ncbi:MAG: class I SAM-dependent methyltransferase [Ardenticatenaceae bacterium]|nr:class I SAM-dependent methyltransferase [Ardenticatenaceae bacterium]
MNCCQCQGIEQVFDPGLAEGDLKAYREDGPKKTTVFLLTALKQAGVKGLTLLDVGGGVGIIQHELLPAGVTTAVHIDASTAYLAASQAEAKRRGHFERVTYQHGNFADLADGLATADIVTLDRVICCYHDMPSLVHAAASKANTYIGLVFPRDTWWLRAASRLPNFGLWLFRNPFRIFVHATDAVDAILRQYGFERRLHKRTFLWQTMLYVR